MDWIREAAQAIRRGPKTPASTQVWENMIRTAYAPNAAKVKALVEAVDIALLDIPDRSHFKAAVVVALRAIKEDLP